MDSLVITVCQNWKPIDHYYYSNAKEALKRPGLHIEPVPIARNNIEALKKHVRGAVLDMIAMREDVTDYTEDFRNIKNLDSIQGEVEAHCIATFQPPTVFHEEIRKTVDEFLKRLLKLAGSEIGPKNLFTKFNESIKDQYQLTSLRSTDREVTVEVMWTR
jgi:hypothetical protein